MAQPRWITHRLVRPLAAGIAVALLTLVFIRVSRPAIFEDRADLVFEQCTKTGLAVFAFTMLVSLARDRRDPD